jgi:TusA-related sulfurtransferase
VSWVEVNLPRYGRILVDRIIDCRGQICPKPQIEVLKALREMRNGEVGLVLITNPPSMETVPPLISAEATILEILEEKGRWMIYFKKR